MPEHEHEHRVSVDVQRDTIVLNLALLRADTEALNAVLDSTDCTACLAIASATWGFTLAAWACGDNADSGGRGTVSERFRAELAEVNARAQADLRQA